MIAMNEQNNDGLIDLWRINDFLEVKFGDAN